MALLSESSRVEAWREWMEQPTGNVSVSKQDIKATIDALDDWFDANRISANQAIPQPARANLTTKQKILGLMVVLKRRLRDGSDG